MFIFVFVNFFGIILLFFIFKIFLQVGQIKDFCVEIMLVIMYGDLV
jgi:hypothetical protein